MFRITEKIDPNSHSDFDSDSTDFNGHKVFFFQIAFNSCKSWWRSISIFWLLTTKSRNLYLQSSCSVSDIAIMTVMKSFKIQGHTGHYAANQKGHSECVFSNLSLHSTFRSKLWDIVSARSKTLKACAKYISILTINACPYLSAF